MGVEVGTKRVTTNATNLIKIKSSADSTRPNEAVSTELFTSQTARTRKRSRRNKRRKRRFHLTL
jgi:hypothetical protein